MFTRPTEGARARAEARYCKSSVSKKQSRFGCDEIDDSPGIPCMRHELGILGFEISIQAQGMRLTAKR